MSILALLRITSTSPVTRQMSGDGRLKLAKTLAKRANTRGCALTSEEPSAVLLPYVSGYIDRQFNSGIDLYAMWKKSRSVQPIPFFSAMFADTPAPHIQMLMNVKLRQSLQPAGSNSIKYGRSRHRTLFRWPRPNYSG